MITVRFKAQEDYERVLSIHHRAWKICELLSTKEQHAYDLDMGEHALFWATEFRGEVI